MPDAERRHSVGRRGQDVANAAQAAEHRSFRPRENWYRDVFLLISLALMLAALLHASSAEKHSVHATAAASRATSLAQDALKRVQIGRVKSISVICAVMDGVSSAGREVIAGSSAAPETPFDRALEALGYPPRGKRIAQARRAAQLYEQNIATRITKELEQVGVRRRPPQLLKADGTVDCRAMLRLSDVPDRLIR